MRPNEDCWADLHSDRSFTFANAEDRCRRLAAHLSRRCGVKKGDRVAVLAMNSTDVMEIHSACAKIGAVFVPINWRLAPPEIDFILSDMEPKVLIYDTANAENVGKLTIRVPVTIETTGGGGDTPYETILSSSDGDYPPTDVYHEDTWTLLYTSCDLPPEAPSFITRVCGFGFHIPQFQFGQARRARSPQIAQTPEEIAWAKQFDEDQIMQDGYRTQHATRPQTLSYAMMDSPVGIAAWLVEKFHDWSDVPVGGIEMAHSKDELLTNIMVYITTGTFNSARWIYYGRREEGGRDLSPEGKRVEVPTGCAVFPAEMPRWPPKSYADRIYNITHWSKMPRGGHFAAMEEPEMLLNDIRKFARSLPGH